MNRYVYKIYTFHKDGSVTTEQYERLTMLGDIKVGECYDIRDFYVHYEYDDDIIDALGERIV